MIKIFSFLILNVFILSQYTCMANDNAVSPQCKDYTKNNFLIKGLWDSEKGGDRLWNFNKLTKVFSKNKAGKCDKEAFTQALDDSKEYWDLINSKYNCPKEGVAQCDSAKSNLSYLGLVSKIYDDNLKNVNEGVLFCNNGITSISKEGIDLAKNAAAAVAALLAKENRCEHIDPTLRLKSNEEAKLFQPENITPCLTKLVTGVFNSLGDIIKSIAEAIRLTGILVQKFGQQMAKFVGAALQGSLATYYTEMYTNGGALLKQITESLMDLPKVIADALKAQDNNYNCMNGKGRSGMICNAIGYVGADVVLAILSGGTSKITALKTVSELKFIPKAPGPFLLSGPTKKSTSRALVLVTKETAEEAAKKAAERAAKEGTEKAAKEAEEKAAKKATEKTATKTAEVEAKNLWEKAGVKFSFEKRPTVQLKDVDIENLSPDQAREWLMKLSGESDPKRGYRKLSMKFHPDRIIVEARYLLDPEQNVINVLAKKAYLKPSL